MTRVFGPMCGADGRVRAHGDDPPVADGEGLCPASGRIHRGEAAAEQDEVGGSVQGHQASGVHGWGTAPVWQRRARASPGHPARRDGVASRP